MADNLSLLDVDTPALLVYHSPDAVPSIQLMRTGTMKRLWAPWRMPYLTGENKVEGCLFCVKIAEDRDAQNLIVYRGPRSFLILNLYPYSNGHLMAVPYQHVPSIEDLDDETLLDLMHTVNIGIKALREVMHPHGFNVGINMGRAAGAGIADHVHIHIVPRWDGDTNFMPVLGEVRVIPQALDETYAQLKAALGTITAP